MRFRNEKRVFMPRFNPITDMILLQIHIQYSPSITPIKKEILSGSLEEVKMAMFESKHDSNSLLSLTFGPINILEYELKSKNTENDVKLPKYVIPNGMKHESKYSIISFIIEEFSVSSSLMYSIPRCCLLNVRYNLIFRLISLQTADDDSIEGLANEYIGMINLAKAWTKRNLTTDGFQQIPISSGLQGYHGFDYDNPIKQRWSIFSERLKSETEINLPPKSAFISKPQYFIDSVSPYEIHKLGLNSYCDDYDYYHYKYVQSSLGNSCKVAIIRPKNDYRQVIFDKVGKTIHQTTLLAGHFPIYIPPISQLEIIPFNDSQEYSCSFDHCQVSMSINKFNVLKLLRVQRQRRVYFLGNGDVLNIEAEEPVFPGNYRLYPNISAGNAPKLISWKQSYAMCEKKTATLPIFHSKDEVVHFVRIWFIHMKSLGRYHKQSKAVYINLQIKVR